MFVDDIAVAGFSSHNPDETGYRSLLHLVNVDCQETTVPIYPDLGWNWACNPTPAVSEGICVMMELDGFLCLYDLENNEFRKFEGEYADRLISDSLEENSSTKEQNPLIFQNDRLVLPIEGSDGKQYIIIYDSRWNQISEPILASDYFNLSCERLVVESNHDTIVYDSNGNKIFALSELGYHDGMQAFSEDVALVNSSSDQLVYVDIDGNILFTGIDDSDAKTITLN